MKQSMKRVITGTPLEKTIRKLYAVLSPSANKSLAYNLQTVDVMRHSLTRHSNCIDVGCHVGSILRGMIKLAPDGTHLAFEPVPDLYQGLVDSFSSHPNVRIYNLALSDTVGETTFQYVVSNPGYSGLRRRKYPRPNERVEEIKVNTDLLDNVVPDDLPIHLIKVDVEGAELQVFKGAIETIKKNQPIIIFEHGAGGSDYYGTTPNEVYGLLVEQGGLKISTMQSWLNNGSALTEEEFSELFYRGIEYYFVAHP